MRTLNSLFVVVYAVCLAAFFTVVPSFLEAKEKINYVGSSTVGVFIHNAALIYKNADFEINTAPESGGGEIATLRGKCGIGGVAREVKPEILNGGVKAFLIGKDAIGAWVNLNNPISTLSFEQLEGIFTGQITNWKEVGGKNLPITIYIVNPQSATKKIFQKIVLGDKKYKGKIRTITPDPAILDKLSNDESGIGQLSFALAINHPAGDMVKKLNIGEHIASVENSNYPITRPLYLITNGEPKGASKAFIDWTLSDSGQDVVKQAFVGIR